MKVESNNRSSSFVSLGAAGVGALVSCIGSLALCRYFPRLERYRWVLTGGMTVVGGLSAGAFASRRKMPKNPSEESAPSEPAISEISSTETAASSLEPSLALQDRLSNQFLLEGCAPSKPNIARLQKLLDSGAQVNAFDSYGVPPFFRAIEAGKPVVVLWSLNRGADLSMEDAQGCSALYHALISGHPGLALWLVKKGARLTEAEKQGDVLLRDVCKDRKMRAVYNFCCKESWLT